jgi:hypothetical protein
MPAFETVGMARYAVHQRNDLSYGSFPATAFVISSTASATKSIDEMIQATASRILATDEMIRAIDGKPKATALVTRAID